MAKMCSFQLHRVGYCGPFHQSILTGVEVIVHYSTILLYIYLPLVKFYQ